MFVIAPVLGGLSGVVGVLLSRSLDVAAGPAIALTAAGFFVLALILRRLLIDGRLTKALDVRRLNGTSLRLKA
jgi:manganese/iron transport system permease protein